MLASALLIESSPELMRNQGMALPKTAMPTNGHSRARVPAGMGVWRSAAKIRPRVMAPADARASTSVDGLMSRTPSLMKRKLVPQIRASSATAA